ENRGVRACFKTRNIVSASLTYLDSFNKLLVLYSYKALTVRYDFYRAGHKYCSQLCIDRKS
ncbi:MAG TPA: hypothetical protein VH415_00595, partial [Nitrososphaeraceae archaeon]